MSDSAEMKRRGPWYWILAGALAAALLYFSLRRVDWRRVWLSILGAQWQYLAMGVALSVVTFFLRSLRWRVLLNAEAYFSVATVFWATMAGYLGNNFLPARAGELVRSLLISGRSSLSKAYVLTTALTERLMDAIALVFCGSVVLLQVNPKPRWMDEVSHATAIIAAAGVIAVFVLPHAEGLVKRLLRRMPLPSAIRDRLLGFAEQVSLGLRAFHHTGRLITFTILTVLIWALDASSVMIGSRGFGLQISFPVALLLLTGMGLGSALPSTPGYVGIYQFVAVTVLPPFGIDRSAALAYIIVAQALGYLVVLCLGLAGLYRIRTGNE
jgi:glycosyltransferase 2 family protein